MSVVIALSLLHFVWEGALIGGVAWCVLKVARTASMRYAIGVVTLALMAIAPLLTAATLAKRPARPSASPSQRASTIAPSASARVPVLVSRAAHPTRIVDPIVGVSDEAHNTAPSAVARRNNLQRIADDGIQSLSALRLSAPFARLLMCVWLIGVALLSVRLTMGWWMARRLTRTFVHVPRVEILANAKRLMEALKIRAAVTVLESALVQVPTAMGWLKPVVLLPAQAMTGLSIAQIDALVAHELAHIKRHDYLVNLLQSAIETLLFYHPVVWMISRRVRHERELCCDDMAIAACGDDRVTYASALADLEGMRHVAAPMLAANGGSLLMRVKRILAPDDVQVVRGRGHWTAGVVILSTAIVMIAAQTVQGRQEQRRAEPGASVNAASKAVSERALVSNLTQPPKTAATVLADVLTQPADAPADEQVRAQQRVIAAGQIVRLEVTVTESATAGMSPRQRDIEIGMSRSQLSAAQIATAQAKVDFERLAKVDLSHLETVETIARTVPGLANDSVVVSYLNAFDDLRNRRAQMKAEYRYEDLHPRIVALDADFIPLERNLTQRLVAVVEAAKLKFDSALDAEERFKAAYQSLVAGSAKPTRNRDLSKDYTVQDDGTILLPYAGRVVAKGLALTTLQTSVRSVLRAKQIGVTSVIASIEARAADAPVPTAKVSSEANATVPVATTPAPRSEVPNSPPSSKPPVESAPKQIQGYVISPNDVLGVSVYSGGISQIEFSLAKFRVQADGTVALPLLAPLKVAGLKVSDANASVRSALIQGKFYNEAAVDVIVLEYGSRFLKVQGAVRNPGNVKLPADRLNIADVLVAAGGLSPTAGQLIRVKRASGATPGPDVKTSQGWEIYAVVDLNNGRLGDVRLADGDTVDVPVGPKFYVQGFVAQTGEFKWEPNLTLERALLKAGGVRPDGAAARVVIRRVDSATGKAAEVELGNDRMNRIIQPNDIIEVPKKRM